MFRMIKSIGGSIALLLMVASLAFAASADKNKGQAVDKTTVNDLYRPFLINNVFNYYSNNGDGSYNKFSGDNEGFEFPKGSGKHVIFEDGVVWGGFHKKYVPGGTLGPKVGGSVYRHGLQAGKIITYGTADTSAAGNAIADDPTLAKYRVFRVRPDISPDSAFNDKMKTLIAETETQYINRYESFSDQDIYNQYIQDWNEWPAADGAPFKDVNGNGIYEPSIDVPGQPGSDQTLWYVANDLSSSRTNNLSGSAPIGIEQQRTVWGYNRTGALGSTIFASTLLINKSGAPVDSMFLVQWADPDLGDAGDDYAGCDVPRSLGYIYNGGRVDATYGTEVPAGGFNFFQGPIVASPGDSAIFRLKYRKGYKNLKMSRFVFFTQGFAAFADPAQGTNGNKQWYNLMNARTAANGVPFTDPKTGIATNFTLAGDPVRGTGWIDGQGGLTPQDRRICMITGPFRMAAGDTQELVVANIAGIGSDRISSISVLRFYSDLAQSAYNGLFNIPNPPVAPQVQATPLDGKIILYWGDQASAKLTEETVSFGYRFEGYNVYQLPSVSGSKDQAKRVATLDIVNSLTTIFDDDYDASTGAVLNKPIQFGSDAGVARSLTLTTDAFTGSPLVNGNPYYYAVTAYSYNPSPSVKPVQLENSIKPITVIPHAPNPGTRYNASTGQAITLTKSAGITTATSEAKVIDPARIVERNYEVRVVVQDSVFNTYIGENVANPKWQVFDATTNQAVSLPSTDYNFSTAEPIVEGVQLGFKGAPFYVAGAELGSLTWTPSGNFNFSGVNSTPYCGYDFIDSKLAPWEVAADVQMEFVAPGQGQKAYDFVRTATSGSAGSVYQGYYDQPFKVYELNPDGTKKRQIDFVFMEDNTRTTFNNIWAPGTATSDREYWFFITETYSPTAKAKYVAGTTTLGVALPGDSCVWSGWYVLTSGSKPAYSPGDVWTIKTTKIVTPADRWTYSTVGLGQTTSLDQAKLDVDRVNVYPNPYLGFSTLETNKYDRFVTFTHLPKKATIRVFNLAGVLLNTIVKDDDTQFARWNLKNTSGFPAAAGMYIVYIDMPEVGKTKTLKLGVIPEQQYIDRW